jgi:plastocyanin
MRGRILLVAALAAFVLQALHGAARTRDEAPKSTGSLAERPAPAIDVTGEVRLADKRSARILKDASDAVVWLVPMDTTADSAQQRASSRRHYRMLQQNKTFEPTLLVVPLGSIVDFPNLDPWFHNVFSLYQGKRFDLGLYQAGAEKEVVFDKPGPSFLFCNIHPQMTAVILTVNSDFFDVSDKSGRIRIPQVPAGRYKMHVWYEDAAPDFKDPAQVIELGSSATILPAVSIPVARHEHTHKDKYGNDYDSEATSPAY